MIKIIDAKNLIVGRMATQIAKMALLGEDIRVVNCEEAVITGKKSEIKARFQAKNQRGTYKGPFLFKQPEQIVKRAIRGMLPYKKPRGEAAFKKIRCYRGLPAEFANQTIETIELANVAKVPNMKYITIGKITKFFGVE